MDSSTSNSRASTSSASMPHATPTRIASYSKLNGHRARSESITSSSDGGGGGGPASSSTHTSSMTASSTSTATATPTTKSGNGRPKVRPVSIIDDALFNSAASPTSLFDKRRSSSNMIALAADSGSLIPRPVSPNARGTGGEGGGGHRTGTSVSFQAAGESIAEEHAHELENASDEDLDRSRDEDWSMRDESTDLFAGKDSPTRTRSRIPVSSVGHARALAEELGPFDASPSRMLVPTLEDVGRISPSHLSVGSRYSLPVPTSPSSGGRRSMIFGGVTGGTTKVLSDLQAGVEHAKKALENTKSQLRSSQRTVAVLTRQTEDLKEGRDRLRLENEGLNNVVARKERLLQEVLERARKAEAEASTLKAQLKSTSTDAKKAQRDMEATVTEATTTSMKAEREYIALKDSIGSMMEQWRREVAGLRADVKRKEEEWAKEREAVALKYKSVLKLQQAATVERSRLETVKTEKRENDAQFEEYFRAELGSLREQFSDNASRSNKAEITADYVAGELARIRQLMRQGNDGRLTFDAASSES